MYAELLPVVWLWYGVERLSLEGSIVANPGYYLRSHEYAVYTHCALIGRVRVIECEFWKEDKVREENKVCTFNID